MTAPVWPAASKAQVAALFGLRTAAERRAAGVCLVEGEVLLGEALDAGLRPRLVAVAAALAEAPVLARAQRAGAAVVLLAQRAAERLSDREHAPGLLAEVALPAPWGGEVPQRGPVLLPALCGLQDPGNVGTLLRSARAFGACACLLTPGTADAFGPKVVRASAGAALRLPVGAAALEALPELARRLGLQPVAAVPPERPDAGPGEGLPERCLLLLGHETRGLPALAGCASASVPQEPGLDSLNVAVAGSILMAGWYRASRSAGPA